MSAFFLGRALLGLGALLYLGLGVWFLIWPEGLSAVGLSADTPAARTELRATYGGLELGLFAFLAWCAVGGRERIRVGLVALALSTLGFALGRVTGLVLDRPSEPIFLTLVAVEVVTTLAAGAAAWRLSCDEASETEAQATGGAEVSGSA
jgi:uncharacterized protein DUF4345